MSVRQSNGRLQYATPLRTDARFKQMLRDLGLASYYRSSGNWGDFCQPVVWRISAAGES